MDASLGLWYAMRSMPLTDDTNVYALVRKALVDAGLHEGRFQAIGVRGQYYEPPVTGFKIDDVRTHVKTTREEMRERKRLGGHRGHGAWQSDWDVRWLYVDHVGKGQKDAVQRYAEILREHGIDATVQPAASYRKKAVAVVEIPLNFFNYSPNMVLVRRVVRFEPWP